MCALGVVLSGEETCVSEPNVWGQALAMADLVRASHTPVALTETVLAQLLATAGGRVVIEPTGSMWTPAAQAEAVNQLLHRLTEPE